MTIITWAKSLIGIPLSETELQILHDEEVKEQERFRKAKMHIKNTLDKKMQELYETGIQQTFRVTDSMMGHANSEYTESVLPELLEEYQQHFAKKGLKLTWYINESRFENRILHDTFLYRDYVFCAAERRRTDSLFE